MTAVRLATTAVLSKELTASLLPTIVKDERQDSEWCKKSLKLCPGGEKEVLQLVPVYKWTSQALRAVCWLQPRAAPHGRSASYSLGRVSKPDWGGLAVICS